MGEEEGSGKAAPGAGNRHKVLPGLFHSPKHTQLIAVTHFIQQFKALKQKNLLNKAEIYNTCSFQKFN